MRTVGGILLVLLVVGCGSGSNAVVRHRSALEWECPDEKVTVIELGGGAWKATGCGHSATYYCQTTGAAFDNNCILESARHMLPQEGSAPPYPTSPTFRSPPSYQPGQP